MTEHIPTPWQASRCDDGLWMLHTDGEVLWLSDANSRGEAFHGANAAFVLKAVNSHDALVQTLERLTQAFRPFTSRPIGGEGSSARLEQQEQIDAHSHALKVLAAAKGGSR